MIYAVIDTNVLVSARISKKPEAATVKVVANMFAGRITPVYNDGILEEYSEVLHRSKFHLDENDIKLMMRFICKHGIHVDRIPYDEDMPDEKDRVFYEVSLSREDSFLVTGNLRHFPVTPKVVSPSELITIVENEQIKD